MNIVTKREFFKEVSHIQTTSQILQKVKSVKKADLTIECKKFYLTVLYAKLK